MSDFRPINVPDGVEPGFAELVVTRAPATQIARDLWALQHRAACVERKDYLSDSETGV